MKVERDLPGGSSRPWIVTVSNGGALEEYVVKLYDNKNLAQVPLHNKEFYAACLAQEFEIPTPESAIIHLSNEFINTLTGDDRIRIEQLSSKFVFGCKFYGGFTDVPVSINSSLVKTLSPETVFAFDVLIRNFDRRKKKPNLITDGNEFFCIDHENSLHVNRLFSEYDIQDWAPFRNSSSCHLFYEYLSKKKDVDFMEFNDLMRSFKTSSLRSVASALREKNIAVEDFEETNAYLEDVIKNKQKFSNLLKGLII